MVVFIGQFRNVTDAERAKHLHWGVGVLVNEATNEVMWWPADVASIKSCDLDRLLAVMENATISIHPDWQCTTIALEHMRQLRTLDFVQFRDDLAAPRLLFESAVAADLEAARIMTQKDREQNGQRLFITRYKCVVSAHDPTADLRRCNSPDREPCENSNEVLDGCAAVPVQETTVT
ncbi:hypothetical protein A0H81_14435 [Grifola frondosa]|uniref:Uncharacterized protein n=1 Tax=Grifola frondosa TaxID=5627 RepID=A0A1C7LM20_GRIFR|nr:hypothetical protein A0H81_14435 [Grifola frondosa]